MKEYIFYVFDLVSSNVVLFSAVITLIFLTIFIIAYKIYNKGFSIIPQPKKVRVEENRKVIDEEMPIYDEHNK